MLERRPVALEEGEMGIGGKDVREFLDVLPRHMHQVEGEVLPSTDVAVLADGRPTFRQAGAEKPDWTSNEALLTVPGISRPIRSRGADGVRDHELVFSRSTVEPEAGVDRVDAGKKAGSYDAMLDLDPAAHLNTSEQDVAAWFKAYSAREVEGHKIAGGDRMMANALGNSDQ